MDEISFNEFLKVDIRVGSILKAETFPEARKPAYKLWIDFGPSIGTKKTSAQITDNYTLTELIGRQVLAVVTRWFSTRWFSVGAFLQHKCSHAQCCLLDCSFSNLFSVAF